MPRLRPRENDAAGTLSGQMIWVGLIPRQLFMALGCLGFTTLYSKGYNINS